jgi:hypothetical protein
MKTKLRAVAGWADGSSALAFHAAAIFLLTVSADDRYSEFRTRADTGRDSREAYQFDLFAGWHVRADDRR